MAISIRIEPIVKFKVKGTIKDAHGVDQPFTFGLTCSRVPEEVIADRIQGFEGTITDFATQFLGDTISDWSEVLDDDKKPVPYSIAAWQQLCRIPGLPMVALAAYRQESGAKAKN
jgi:hypothetical protein